MSAPASSPTRRRFSSSPTRRRFRRVILAAVIALDVVGTVIARRRGYKLGGNVVVRCRKGHLFTTIWIPGASLKAVRLGWYRWQRCPVGDHWTLVEPVKEADLSVAERRSAAERRDLRVP